MELEIEKNVLLAAVDKAPGDCFERLKNPLQFEGFAVKLMLDGGQPGRRSVEEIRQAVSTANFVLLGMSSSPALAETEIVAGQIARELGIPFGFYADIARWRPWLVDNGLAAAASLFLGVSQQHADAAGEAFTSARLVGTGNPKREDMQYPRTTREEVRETLGIPGDAIMILAPGTKFCAGNLSAWSLLQDAALRFWEADGVELYLVLTPHPNDLAFNAQDPKTSRRLGIYEELVANGQRHMHTMLVTSDVMLSSDMVPGSDVVFGHGSSPVMEAGCQGVPAISAGSWAMRTRAQAATGTSTLEEVDEGFAESVEFEPRALEAAIRRLLTEDGFALLRERQLAACPRVEQGTAVRNIVQAIELQLA